MAFIWEVEALRKILDTILEGGEAQERYDFGKDLLEKSKKGKAKKSDAAIRDEKIAREQFELGPDDPLPARWEVDSDGLAWDLTPFDHQEEQREEARYPYGRPTDDPDDPRNYPWDYKSGDEDAFNKALKAYEDRQRSPVINDFLDALSNVPSDEAGVDPDDPREAEDKFKLEWVNEILQEFPADKAPEVLRLPHEKDEKDMSPFLSYMLSQSPYARLPAAGLLGIGSMLYSKPAY